MMASDAFDVLVGDSPGEGALLERLRGRLADRATDAGLVEVAYRLVPSPVGDLLVAATDVGLVRVAFIQPPASSSSPASGSPPAAGGGDRPPPATGVDAVLGELATQVGPRVLEAPGRLDPVARQLDEWFAGRRDAFDLDLDLRLASGFRRAVVAALPTIPRGATATYAEIAERVGSPRAVRAVGTACARNPVPIVVPCHRVVRSDGSLGGYAGGQAAKRALLVLEGGWAGPPPPDSA